MVAISVASVDTWYVPISASNSPTKLLVPGRPTDAIVNSMNRIAYFGMLIARPP